MKEAIIVFVKNPEKGKVKTRLAKTIGDDNALKIYKKLLEHTADVIDKISADKHIFYSNFIDQELMHSNFNHHLQVEEDLGGKMKNAFETIFSLGYTRVVIVGSDCYELSSEHVKAAFEGLSTKDVVIGPAKDGGYYLLGMRSLVPMLFQNKIWSTSSVCADTIKDIETLNLSYLETEKLSDIDFEEDLGDLKNILK